MILPPPPGPLEPALVRWFQNRDATLAGADIFRMLQTRFGHPAEEIQLTLERVFSHRRFDIIRWSDEPVNSIFDLRSPAFYGFYLSHLAADELDFVYACNGVHLEFGTRRCTVQTALNGDLQEFAGAALLGLARDPAGEFVFVVTRPYQEWVRPNLRPCATAYAHFATPAELANAPAPIQWIWPEPPAFD